MKERIQKIIRNQKAELIICIMAIFLSVMCFVSSNTARTAESGQDGLTQVGAKDDPAVEKNDSEQPAQENDPEQPAGKNDPVQPAENNSLAQSAQKNDSEQVQPAQDVYTEKAFSYAGENADARKDQEPVFNLDEAVGQAVLSYYKDLYMGMECTAEGHEILDYDQEQDGQVTVYALTMYGEYGFEDNCLVKGAGSGVIPAVMKFSYDKTDGYVLKEYQKSEDDSDRQQWIQSMFPGALWESCSSFDEEVTAALAKQEQAYAEQYLLKLGREAPIGKDADSERQVLTDAGVSVEVSNKLFELDEQLENYPYWIGSQEELEGGVRYVYELALAEETEEIVYTKTEYDTDEVIEQFRFDMHTGEEITG